MEPEILPDPATPPSSHATMRFVFLNELGLRAGWRLLIFVAILLTLAFALSAVVGLIVHAIYGPGPRQFAAFSPWVVALQDLAQFIPVLLAAWIMSKIEHRRAGVYGLPIQRSAIFRFLIGYVIWGFLPLTLVLLIMRAFGAFHFGTPGLSVSAALSFGGAWAVAFLCVGLFEEYLTRGYALYTLGDGIGFWPAAILLGLLFGGGHLANPGESRIGIAAAILFGLFAAATLRRTGNLWLAVGAHAGWDWGQSYFYGVNDSGIQAIGHLFNPPPVQGPAWLTGGTVGPEGSIVTLIVWSTMMVGFLVFYRSEHKIISSSGQRSAPGNLIANP